MHRIVGALLAMTVCVHLAPGCSDDSSGTNQTPDGAQPDGAVEDGGADGGEVQVGPLLEMPLIDSPIVDRPFNHSAEVTIAAFNGHVALAYINMHFLAADTFDTTGFHKRVGVAVSHDRGDSFGPGIDPGGGTQTTDPVIRAGSDGSLWLATWDTDFGRGTLVSSTDHGENWQTVVTDISLGDKEWIAIDDAGQAVYLGAVSGFWKYGFDGTTLAHEPNGGMMLGAYVDSGGAHFATTGPDDSFVSLSWDGSGSPIQEGQGMPGGAGNMELNVCASLGRTSDGGQWVVRATRTPPNGAVMLRVRHLPGDEGTDIQISRTGTVAFFPAAATDNSGRLHVIWYEISGAAGVLKYTKSVSSDLTQGFDEAIVIDPDACPGGDWYPYFSSAEGGRRLREYIDITVDGNRAHLAWTHAPVAPSRVYSAYVQF
jgi:hypothetical protein